MGNSWVSWRRVKQRLVRLTGANGLGHGVVDFQYDALSAVFAIFLLVFALDNGEGLPNIVHIVALNAVEVEVGGV